MTVLSSLADLEIYLSKRGTGCALVPTMGALHAGHARLVEIGATIARERNLPGCMATVFVNPTQFNDPADLARYPRTLDHDADLCRAAGADAVFAPRVDDIYPPGRPIPVPPLPPVATRPGLEDAHRPGHFAGVAQVVQRLFDLTRPAVAVFGEKDWQQLAVIRALAGGAGPEIVPAATVRTPSGLAMSSRNRFLSPAQAEQALAIPRALEAAARAKTPVDAQAAMASLLADAGLATEYAVVRDAETLLPLPPDAARGSGRALIAARLGSVRLIDNAPW